MTAHQDLSGPLGRYVIVRKLGAGGMGAVYLAEDSQLGRKVALKVPHFTEDAGAVVVERFRREARLAASIEHPNLCPVHDVGEAGGILFFTMPFIEGTVLSRLIEEGKPWPALKAVELVRKIAGAVAHLHQHGIVHRDLKPSNIMLRASGEPLLMDFGLARSFTSETERLTSTGTPLGSPAYMSPEQVAGASDVGPAADVYGLGMILYELLTSRLPFRGTLTALFAQVVNTPPAPPSSLCSGLDARLDALCLKALRKKPEDRHESVAAFAAELSAYAGQQRPPLAASVPTVARVQQPAVATQTMDLFPATMSPNPLDRTEAQRGTASGRGPRVPRWNRAWLLAGVFVLLAAGAGAWIVIGGGTAGVDQPKPKDQPKDGTDREFENSLRMKMVLIPKGRFQMGSPEGDKDSSDDEHPQHEVEISRDFHMATTKVTFGQFRQFVKEDSYQTEVERNIGPIRKGGWGFDVKTGKFVGGPEYTWKNTGWEQTDEHPVVNVTWNDAVKFCEWLSRKENKVYELPTEAEWEYACRAGGREPYCFGKDVVKLSEYAWYDDNAGKSGAQPVGKKKANAWGLYDMHGNAWEWCLDGEQAYQKGHIKDPVGDVKAYRRVLRGGSWCSTAGDCRSAHRFFYPRDLLFDNFGFRVVLRVLVRNP